LATTAIEYGETNHRADTQTHIDELLNAAAEKTEQASRWLVSWLTALGCLFIIGAFY
jgi:predicted NBD/HSP70 family sugar kinase